MTSHSRPDINGPTTAAKEAAEDPEGVSEHPDAPTDVKERLDTDPQKEPNLIDQPGHAVGEGLQADT